MGDCYKVIMFLVNVRKSSYLVPTLNLPKAPLGRLPTKGLTLAYQSSDPCPEAVLSAQDINLYEIGVF